MIELRNKKLMTSSEYEELIQLIGGGISIEVDGIMQLTDKEGFTSYHKIIDLDTETNEQDIPNMKFTGDVKFPANEMTVDWNGDPIKITNVLAGENTTFRTLDNGSKASVAYDKDKKELTYTVDPTVLTQNAIIAEVSGKIVGNMELMIHPVETEYEQYIIYSERDFNELVPAEYRATNEFKNANNLPWLLIIAKNAPEAGQKVLMSFNRKVNLNKLAQTDGIELKDNAIELTVNKYFIAGMGNDLGLTIKEMNGLEAYVTPIEETTEEEVEAEVVEVANIEGYSEPEVEPAIEEETTEEEVVE